MRNKLFNQKVCSAVRHSPKSKIQPPPPAIIRLSDHTTHLELLKKGPKPRQLLSLPPFPGHHLPGRKSSHADHVTAFAWLKYYFDDIPPPAIQKHFNKGLVQMEVLNSNCSMGLCNAHTKSVREIKHSDIMEVGARVYVPVTIAESSISKRFDIIPSGTTYLNAEEIEYLHGLVKYKDSSILVLNKPPKLPGTGSMDALAAAALSYDYDEGPKLVHRMDRESSGLLVMGRTSESVSHLQWLFSDGKKATIMSKDWSDAYEAMYQRYWALVIGSPKEKEGVICAPLMKVPVGDGKTERVILAHNSGLEASQEATTEYRVLGPTINGCSWIELLPQTNRKHQLRVHCAEALGTPIVGDYKYGWFVHNKWKQMPRVDFEPSSGEPYKLRRPKGLDVQKGSVLSKVPLMHLHCREMVLPNIAQLNNRSHSVFGANVLRFVAPMPSHMKITWNLMSSYLV